jgi:hypothetical protein
MKKISKKQFKLAITAVSNGVYYSANPDRQEVLQDAAISDLKDLSPEEKEKYMELREFGKNLYLVYPKGTTEDEVLLEYVDTVFNFIKKEEDNEGI